MKQLTYYDEKTYYLHDILVQDCIHWNILQTEVSKRLVKLKTISFAHTLSVNSTKMNAYIRFTRTRCMSFKQFQFQTRNYFKNENTIIEWKSYLDESWSEINTNMRHILKIECKIVASIQRLYQAKYQTHIQVPFRKHYIGQIYKIASQMNTIEQRIEQIEQDVSEQTKIRTEIILG